MAIRATEGEVLKITDTELTDLKPFIRTASILVDSLAARDTNSDLTAATLKQIEVWLAAHFVALRDPVALSEKTGEAQITYFLGKPGMGLEATPYGQAAISLDTTGRLATVGKKRSSFISLDLGL